MPLGLRTVSGICNNLESGQETFSAVDQLFPRLSTPQFIPAENGSSYAPPTGLVTDSEPRVISNLIVDQTSTSPAARQAAGYPVRTQGNVGIAPCNNGETGDCVPQYETLFIPNDIGLAPPLNGLFTIFGQFFDHGLDKIVNGGAGSVFAPLRADDPLIARPDHQLGTSDDLSAHLRFMTLTRGPARGLPQYVTAHGLEEGDTIDPNDPLDESPVRCRCRPTWSRSACRSCSTSPISRSLGLDCCPTAPPTPGPTASSAKTR